jgi:hypothetical protein
MIHKHFSLNRLVEEILPNYDNIVHSVGIFSTPYDEALVINTNKFIQDIEEECEKY